MICALSCTPIASANAATRLPNKAISFAGFKACTCNSSMAAPSTPSASTDTPRQTLARSRSSGKYSTANAAHAITAGVVYRLEKACSGPSDMRPLAVSTAVMTIYAIKNSSASAGPRRGDNSSRQSRYSAQVTSSRPAARASWLAQEAPRAR